LSSAVTRSSDKTEASVVAPIITGLGLGSRYERRS
jgi:hypothetical protein